MKFDLSIKKNKLIYFLLALIVGAYITFLSTRPTDLDVFMDGAAKFQNGANPYAGPYVRDLQYYYSPFFAMLLSFFSWVPMVVLKFSWMVLILVAWWRIFHLFRGYFPDELSHQRTMTWKFTAVALIVYFIILNIRATQMTVFMVWAAFESVALVKRNKPIYAGLLLGLFINIKLLLLPFLAYLVYRGYFKAALFTVLGFILYMVLPALFVGWQNNLDLHSMWWNTINPQNQEHLFELETGRYSLSALLPVYVSPEIFPKVLLASRAFFVLLFLYFLNTKPFAPPRSDLFLFRELSYLCLVTILIFPHQGSYAFFFLFPVFMYLTHFFFFHFKDISKPARYVSLGIFITCLVLLFLGKDIVPDDFYFWMFKYHLMTWAIIGFIPVLAILSPKRIRK